MARLAVAPAMTAPSAVTVVGAGNMGHGLAVHLAAQGLDVTLVDHRQSNLDRAAGQIRDAASFLVEADLADLDPDGVVEATAFTTDLAAGVASADLVLESVAEDLEVKREVFRGVAAAAPDDALLASNTSGLPVTAIAEAVPGAADRVGGCHWWFPPYLLRPVEVVRGERTSDATVDRLVAFVEAVDREPVRVERDVPGFVWNRVQNAVVRECCHIVEQGIASVEDVNLAIRDGYATRTAAIGPFETMDIAGLALFRRVAEETFPHLSDADEPSPLFDERLDAGRGGIEDGAGFFDYDEPPEAVTRRRDHTVAAIRRAVESVEE